MVHIGLKREKFCPKLEPQTFYLLKTWSKLRVLYLKIFVGKFHSSPPFQRPKVTDSYPSMIPSHYA